MISFDLLAQHLDMRDFFEEELEIPVIRISGSEMTISCPNPLHVDNNPSCSFNKVGMMYNCFSCGEKGNIIDLVAQYKDMSHVDAIKYLKRFLGMDAETVAKSFKRRYTQKSKTPEFMLSSHFRRDWENANEEITKFVTRRDFNLELFNKYYIGYNNMNRSITIPVVYKRSIINIAERFVYDTGKEPKIKYEKDSKMNKCIWGIFEDYDRNNAYFTEGVFDAVRLREAGFNAFAMLTNMISKDKEELILSHFDGKLTIVPDADNGGRIMINDWKRILHRREVDIVELGPYKDADIVPITTLKCFCKNNRQTMTDKIVGSVRVREEICNKVVKR